MIHHATHITFYASRFHFLCYTNPVTSKNITRIRLWVSERLFGFLRGLGPRGATSRNAWYLYQDLIWLGFASAASNYINVYAIRLGASEQLLGLRAELGGLRIDPQLPESWSGYQASRTFRGARINVSATKKPGINQMVLKLNGKKLSNNLVPAPRPGTRNRVNIIIPD